MIVDTHKQNTNLLTKVIMTIILQKNIREVRILFYRHT